MMSDQFDKIIEQTLQSLDGARRAVPRPYLITRIKANMQQRDMKNAWAKLNDFLSRPAIAWTIILMLLVGNLAIIIMSRDSDRSFAKETMIEYKDESAMNMTDVYDIDNPEP